MTIHLLRTSAGIRDLAQLQEIQAHFRTRNIRGAGVAVVVTTRNMPKRAAELLEGGSVYWIIRNAIQARQEIRDIKPVVDADGEKYCQILINPEIIRVVPVAQKAVQGWRYLESVRAPRDIGVLRDSGDVPPEEMARELRAMGLL